MRLETHAHTHTHAWGQSKTDAGTHRQSLTVTRDQLCLVCWGFREPQVRLLLPAGSVRATYFECVRNTCRCCCGQSPLKYILLNPEALYHKAISPTIKPLTDPLLTPKLLYSESLSTGIYTVPTHKTPNHSSGNVIGPSLRQRLSFVRQDECLCQGVSK